MRLHDYQELGVKYLRKNPRSALFLDMGLGKTATVLSALEPRHLPVLVTAPKRVVELVWEEEVRLWRPDLSVVLAVGSPAQRRKALESGADIVVLGRDNLRDAVDPKIARRFSTFVIDEMSGFKNRGAARWAAARKISRQVEYVWGMTGTPSPNGLLDLWAPIFLLDEGERLGRTLTAYRQRYFFPARVLPNGVVSEWAIREGADKRIHALLEDIALSMGTEGRINLPPVTFNRVKVTLEPKVRRLYRQMKNHLVADLRSIGGLEIHSAANAAALMSKLAQLTAGFMYMDDQVNQQGEYDLVHREKMRALQEIVDSSNGESILVFYWYQQELEMLKETFGSALATLDDEDILVRWNTGQVPLLAVHPASAGHGLNLQHGGHIAVWTTLPMMNLEIWQQANKRLARQGQKHPVVIHVLEAERTVDGVQWDRLVLKEQVQTALLNHLESPL